MTGGRHRRQRRPAGQALLSLAAGAVMAAVITTYQATAASWPAHVTHGTHAAHVARPVPGQAGMRSLAPQAGLRAR